MDVGYPIEKVQIEDQSDHFKPVPSNGEGNLNNLSWACGMIKCRRDGSSFVRTPEFSGINTRRAYHFCVIVIYLYGKIDGFMFQEELCYGRLVKYSEDSCG